MLFNKSIVAFVAAITLATSVAAAATPSPNGAGQNPGSPSQSQDKSQGTVQGSNQGSTQPPTCISGLNPMCCDAVALFTTLSDDVRTQLKSLDSNLNQNGNVGQNCAPPVGSQGWYCVPSLIFLFDEWLTRLTSGTQKPLCCDAVQSASQFLLSLRLLQSELADELQIRWSSQPCPQLRRPYELKTVSSVRISKKSQGMRACGHCGGMSVLVFYCLIPMDHI
jgi:hypothetical protein